MLIGLHGKLGSGKDVVYERLRVISPVFVRHSFADKLKDSACALLGISRERMEMLKRDTDWRLVWTNHSSGSETGQIVDHGADLTMRLFLQRYGTEAHREVFGDNFWVEQAMGPAIGDEHGLKVPVFTDCRFPNEAEAIREAGGEVWRIIGPQDDTGDHPSEKPLPDNMIAMEIDNTERNDSFASLDAQLKVLVGERIDEDLL